MKKICIVGVGLIGGSLGLALRQAKWCQHVAGYGRNSDPLQRAVDLGAIDSFSTEPTIVSDCDLIFLATPVGTYPAVLNQIRDHLAPSAIITDGGSTKSSVVRAAREVFGELPARFVPGHPIAGKEKSGVEHADANLYQNHKVILTPADGADAEAVKIVTDMWHSCGAIVETLDAEQHDRVLAATSHLPHVIAYALVNAVAETTYVQKIFDFAAGGFRDSSRVASSDPTMWRDICLENREAILEMTARYRSELENVERLIEQGDGQGLYDLFETCKKVRDARFG